MARFFSTAILSSSIVIFISSVFLAGITLSTRRESFKDEPGMMEKNVEIYEDAEGTPKFAQGLCKINADCTLAGCGQEFCSNDPNLITTCILRPDAPDKSVYSCGCVDGNCVWYK